MTDSKLVLSPLADPVVNAIYANVEVAGLAMESLIRLILEADNQKLKGKIKSITPQQIYTSTRNRSCRVDIANETDANEKIIAAIQTNPDPHIMVRNIFEASHIFMDTSDKGTTHAQLAAKMPKVIFINLLAYKLRNDSMEMVQPFKVMYTNAPKVAIPHFSGYNIELPRVLEMEADFSNGLYCWAYTLFKSHSEEKTVQEVIAMSTALQEYAKADEGYQQFSDRYEFVAADPKTRHEYVQWAKGMLREQGEMQWAIDQRLLGVAEKMLKRNRPVEEIVEDTGLSFEEVEDVRKNLSNQT